MFSMGSASSPVLLSQAMRAETLITGQDAPSAFLQTSQGKEINTEEGFCNRTYISWPQKNLNEGQSKPC